MVGQDIYRLVLVDFIFCLLGSFFGEFLRRWVLLFQSWFCSLTKDTKDLVFFSKVRKREVLQKRGCGTTETSLVVSTRHSLWVHALCMLHLLPRRRSECVPFHSPNVSFFAWEMEAQAGRQPHVTPLGLLNGVTKDQLSPCSKKTLLFCICTGTPLAFLGMSPNSFFSY